jgi:hypothetical protein
MPPAWPTGRPVFGTHTSPPAHAHGLSAMPPHGPPAFETQAPGPLPATPLSTGPVVDDAGHALASSAVQTDKHVDNSRVTRWKLRTERSSASARIVPRSRARRSSGARSSELHRSRPAARVHGTLATW